MRYLKRFESFINESKNDMLILEALSSDIAKFYLEINSKVRDERLANIWSKLTEMCLFSKKDGDRIYFQPFELTNMDLIEEFLDNEGYEIIDYKNNKAFDRKNNREGVKITKILSNIGIKKPYALDLLKGYNNEASKGIESRGIPIDSSKYIVFSKDKLDIAQMGTDRKWPSCMNLYDGGNKDYVSYDIMEGTFIVYLIDSDDTNIENPDARILVKPYQDVSNENDIYFFTEDKVYGNAPSNFLRTVNSIIEKVQSIKKPVILKLISNLYCDNESYRKRLEGLKKDLSPLEAIKYYLDFLKVENYTISDDLVVDVDGDVDMSQKGFKQIPIKFGKVTGDFNCSGNLLKTLINSPKEVGGSFSCGNNILKTLHSSPRIVGGSFNANDNEIQSLKGCPDFIGDVFFLYSNQITIIDSYPKTLKGNFDISYNLNLKSLEGLPERIEGGVNTYSCNLSTLKGSPIYVGGDFICESNNLKSLEFSPKQVLGNFNCSRNDIRTLEGSPSEIGKDYDCRHNRNLNSLIGSPEEIGKDFNISFSYSLESFDNAPKVIFGNFIAKSCYAIAPEEEEKVKKNVIAKNFMF